MPHEVIMPALGMAQDTGLIVAWHKRSGDPVKADDVLFEVETDKATMEVQAGADGFVTQISADAGDEVPVGNVIALIGDSADAVDAKKIAGDAPVPAAKALPTGRDVIMPALGMAQDTGLIVAWHKAPGDAVAASDILFEVETDKATMEVEAGHDGYVAALLAEAGEDAPVGDPIAIISAVKPQAPVQLSRSGQTAPAAPKPAEATAPAAAPAKPVAPAKPPVVATSGRILASPKARRLAMEQGMDLNRLAKAGVPQPFHVSDLEALKSLPAEATATTATAALHISARAPASAFAEFAAKLTALGISGNAPVLAAFAAASLRATGIEGSIVVRLDTPIFGQSEHFADPDLVPLSHLTPSEPDGQNLVLRDLTASRITGLTLAAGAAPSLNISRDDDAFVLALDFIEGQLTADAAIQLIDGVAARLEAPLRHLL